MKVVAACLSAVAVLSLLSGSSALAATVTTTAYDTNLTSTGWNVGSGQSNGHFKTVNFTNFTATRFGTFTLGTIELGLRASLRGIGAVADSDDNGIYEVPGGSGTAPNLAKWNFDYSVNLSGIYNTVTTTNWLYVDINPSATATTFIPINLNLGYGFVDPVQDSQNLGFYSPPIPFNPNTPGTYDIALASFVGLNLVASNSIQIVVSDEGGITAAGVPLPTTALAATPLFALTALRRRR